MRNKHHAQSNREAVLTCVPAAIAFCIVSLTILSPCDGETVPREVKVGAAKDGGIKKSTVGYDHWAHGAKDLRLTFKAVPAGQKIEFSRVNSDRQGGIIWCPVIGVNPDANKTMITIPAETHTYEIAGVTPNVPYVATFSGWMQPAAQANGQKAKEDFDSTVCHIDVDGDTNNDSNQPHRPPAPSGAPDDPEDAGEKLRSGETAEAVGIAMGVNDDHDQYWPGTDPWDRDMNRKVGNEKKLDISKEGAYYENRTVDVAQIRVVAKTADRTGKIRVAKPDHCNIYDEQGAIVAGTFSSAPTSRDALLPVTTATTAATMYLSGLSTGEDDIVATFEPDAAKTTAVDVVKDIIRVTIRKCDIDESGLDANDLLEDRTDKGIWVPSGETLHVFMTTLYANHFGTTDRDLFYGLNPKIRLRKLSGGGNVKVYWKKDANTYGLALDTSEAIESELTGLKDGSNNDITIWKQLTETGSLDSLCVTGVDSGEIVLGLEFTVNNDSNTPTRVHADTIRLFVGVDLDVDSDNNGTITDADDHIEDDANMPGKYVMVNDDDGDDDSVPDYADGYALEAGGKYSDVPTTSTFIAMKLKIPASLDPNVVRLRFNYEASDPNGVKKSTGTPPYEPPATGFIRIWRKDETATRSKAKVGQGDGDFVAKNDDSVSTDFYTGTQLGLSESQRETPLYVEAVKPGASEGAIRIVVTVDPDGPDYKGWKAGDAVRVTPIRVDADADSDNNLSVSSEPYCVEDYNENKNGDDNKPGKIVPTNINDDDGDTIPDFIDGYNRFPDPNYDQPGGSEVFHDLKISVPAPIVLSKARIKLVYSEASPQDANRTPSRDQDDYEFTKPSNGHIRVWAVTGASARDSNSVSDDGDYVPSSTIDGPDYYSPAKLLGTGARSKTLYIEGINPGSTQADQQIKVLVDPDGEGNASYMAVDMLRASVAEVTFAKNTNTQYGYDKYELVPTSDGNRWVMPMKDFVSVQGDGNSTSVTATITGVRPAFVAFDYDASVFTVSPTAGSDASQVVTITGASLGSNLKLGPKDMKARVNVVGNNLNYNVLGVCTYKLMKGEGTSYDRLRYKLFRVNRDGHDNELGVGDLLTPQEDKEVICKTLRQTVLWPYFVTPDTINSSKYDDPNDAMKNAYGRTRPDGRLYISVDANKTAEEKQVETETSTMPTYTRKIIYVRDVRLTWGLDANAAQDANVINLISVYRLSPGDTLTLEGYDAGGTFHSEGVTIKPDGVDAANKRITVTNGIQHAYVYDGGKKAWIVGNTGGWSGDPIYIGDDNGGGGTWTRPGLLGAIAHEIGHNNDLNHVDATDNLMNPMGNGGNLLLRYRGLQAVEEAATKSQWHEETRRE